MRSKTKQILFIQEVRIDYKNEESLKEAIKDIETKGMQYICKMEDGYIISPLDGTFKTQEIKKPTKALSVLGKSFKDFFE